MRHFLFCALAAAGLAGCTPDLTLATAEPYTPQWCEAAKAQSGNANSLYAVARCHERNVPGFAQDDNVIVFYLNEAARRGHVEAGAALAARGQPLPDDDLRREAVARAEAERNRQAMITALRPPPPPRPAHPSVLFPGGGPRMYPSTVTSPRPMPPTTQPPRPTLTGRSPTSVSVQENRSTSTRRNCVNNVCRTETTTCVNGRCTTSVSQ
jgi:hypothetical protein